MPTQEYYEDELSLLDIYKVLKAYWRSILIIPITLAFVVFMVTWLLVPPNYEAQGIIDIGKVNDALLESPEVLVDRLNQPAFIEMTMASHPDLLSNNETAKDMQFLAKKNKDSNLVSFKIVATNRELALKSAKAVIDSLSRIHKKAFDDSIGLVKERMLLIDHHINLLKDSKVLSGRSLSSSYDTVLKALTDNDRTNQISSLMNLKLELEASLNSPKNYNTKLLDQIFVSREPTSPNLPLLTLVAFFLGLFGAVFAAFIRHSFKAA